MKAGHRPAPSLKPSPGPSEPAAAARASPVRRVYRWLYLLLGVRSRVDPEEWRAQPHLSDDLCPVSPTHPPLAISPRPRIRCLLLRLA